MSRFFFSSQYCIGCCWESIDVCHGWWIEGGKKLIEIFWEGAVEGGGRCFGPKPTASCGVAYHTTKPVLHRVFHIIVSC